MIVPVLLLGVSCSSPLRETSEPARSAEEQPAAETAPAPPPARPTRVVDEPVVVAPEVTEQPVEATAAPPPPPEVARAPVVVDPVKALFAEEERRIERAKTIASLAAERDAAAAVVMRREKDLLAMKNPFLPRPQLAANEQEELKGLGGAARARWAERQVVEARALLEAAQKAYDAAKANP